MRPSAPLVVVARSREGNLELQRLLAERGVSAAGVETIRMDDPETWDEVDEAIRGAPRLDWVAFTSPRAVVAFLGRLRALGMKAKDLGPRFAAVGPSTASELRGAGIEVGYVPGDYLTSALGKGLPGGAGSRVLLLRADRGDKKLVSLLEGRGFEVKDVVAYRTKFVTGPVEPGMPESARIVAFASPSEVEGFRARVGSSGFRTIAGRATAACIGPVTARAARQAGFKSVASAGEHTIEALAEKVEEMLVHA